MTEPKKKSTGAKPDPRRLKAAANKTALGQTVTDAPSARQTYHDDIKAAARALWQSDPKITKRQVAEEMNIPYATIDRWSKGDDGRGEPWAKSNENMSERAHAIADAYRGKLAELGPEITTEQQKQVMADTADDTAAELRAKVLERHRKEWNVPRALVSEAVKDRSFDKAKLAKITSETLKIVQDAERKAWGVDSGSDAKVHVVIERE